MSAKKQASFRGRAKATASGGGFFTVVKGTRHSAFRGVFEDCRQGCDACREGLWDVLILTEAQRMAIEKAKEKKKGIETELPGYLGAQDRSYVGSPTGLQQTIQKS